MATLDKRINGDGVIIFPVLNVSAKLRGIKVARSGKLITLAPTKNRAEFTNSWKFIDITLYDLISAKLCVKDADVMRHMLRALTINDQMRPCAQIASDDDIDVVEGVYPDVTAVCKSIQVRGSRVVPIWTIVTVPPEPDAIHDASCLSDDESEAEAVEEVQEPELHPEPDHEDMREIRTFLKDNIAKEIEDLGNMKANLANLYTTIVQMKDMLTVDVDATMIDIIDGCLADYRDAKSSLFRKA
eukprot:gene19612-26296_t